MRKTNLILVLSLFATIANCQQKEFKPFFLNLENKLMMAYQHKNKEIVADLFANDFLLTSSLSKGEVKTKEDCLQYLGQGAWKSFTIDSLSVRMYNNDNTAIVNVWARQTARANKKDWSGLFMDTDVWIRISSNWKLASRHSSWIRKQS